MLDTGGGKLLGEAVQGIAFADRTEIDFETRPAKANRAHLWIQLDVPAANALQGRGDLVLLRQVARTLDETPDARPAARP